jgi:hypothetical protein
MVACVYIPLRRVQFLLRCRPVRPLPNRARSESSSGVSGTGGSSALSDCSRLLRRLRARFGTGARPPRRVLRTSMVSWIVSEPTAHRVGRSHAYQERSQREHTRKKVTKQYVRPKQTAEAVRRAIRSAKISVATIEAIEESAIRRNAPRLPWGLLRSSLLSECRTDSGIPHACRGDLFGFWLAKIRCHAPATERSPRQAWGILFSRNEPWCSRQPNDPHGKRGGFAIPTIRL